MDLCIAKQVRERKETSPHLYCPDPRCLWRVSSGPCPKHDPRGRKNVLREE